MEALPYRLWHGKKVCLSLRPQTLFRNRRARHIEPREITGVGLADRIGCSQGTIARVERGRIRPSVGFIESFVRKLLLLRDESVRCLLRFRVCALERTCLEKLQTVLIDWKNLRNPGPRQDL